MFGVAGFLLAFSTAYLGTRLLLRVPLRRGFVDVPNERSSHEAPKPRFGGIALFAGFAAAFMLFLWRADGMGAWLPVLVGGTLVFVVGVLDDFRSLGVLWRLGGQFAAAGIVVAGGHVVDVIALPLGGSISLGAVAVPFTVLFIVASINFYNFIDGIDGLAAGSAVIAGGFLATIAFLQGHPTMGLVCLALAGGSLGFLQFNFPPSRLFMGDGGSTFLGFAFAVVAVVGNGLSPSIPLFIPVLILSSLYLDAGLTLLRRALKGERVFQPHRTHYYQRLLSLGLNHKQVTVVEYALTVLLGVCAVVFFEAGRWFSVVLTVAWVAVFSVLVLKIRSLERGDRLFWERRTAMVIAGDLLLVTLAYFGAYFLRLNFRFTEAEGMAVLRAFPIVLVVRSACFYYYGLYRGMWKYTSTPDVVRIVKAVTTGTAIIMVLLVLFYRFVAFPRSLFVIEYFLLIAAIGGSRFASRWFHEMGREALGAGSRRIAIVGAGDFGERTAREIRSADGPATHIVCFIDDDPEKIGLTLHGIPVVGPIARLSEICKRDRIDAIVLAVAGMGAVRAGSIVREARKARVEIDSGDATRRGKRVPAAVMFDRINRVAERPLPLQPGAAVVSHFRDKRVLITGGGEVLGRALVHALMPTGAEIFVHSESAADSVRFEDLPSGACTLCVGSLDRDRDAGRLLEGVRPDMVIHVASLRVPGAVDTEGVAWRTVVRSVDVLARQVARRGEGSLLLVTVWPHRIERRDRLLGAVAEARVLGATELADLGPRVLRLPDVLTEERLDRALLAGGAGGASVPVCGVLAPEAAAVCLELAAAPPVRGLYVPVEADIIRPESVATCLGDKRPNGARSRDGDIPPLLHAAETATPTALPGLRRVSGPLWPVEESLGEFITECMRSQSPSVVRTSVDAVERVLSGDSPALSTAGRSGEARSDLNTT